MDEATRLQLGRARMVKTCVLPLTFLALGLYAGIRGPTLLDLQDLLQCSIESLSSALMFFPIGLLLGSISGAVLTDRFTHLADTALAISCIVAAVSYGAVPWASNLWLVALLNFIAGFSQGNINVACSSLTMRAWGPDAASPIHALHAFHSVGMLVAAPLAGPFLSNTNQTLPTATTHRPEMSGRLSWPYVDTDPLFSNATHNASTHIRIPYAIVGGIGVAAGISFAVFQCLGWTFYRLAPLGQAAPTEQLPNSRSDEASSRNKPPQPTGHIGDENKCLKALFLISLFLIYVCIMYRDSVNSLFLFAIGVRSHLHMSKSLSTIMTTSYFASGAAARLLSILYTKWINIHIIVFLELGACLLLCTLIVFFALQSVVNLWLLTNLLSFLSAPTYPTIMAWSNHYLAPSGVVVAVIDLGIGAGNFSATWLGGFLFDNYGAQSIFYLSLAFAVLMVLIVVPLQIYAHLCVRARERRLGGGRVAEEEGNDRDVDERTPLINQ